MSLTNRAYRYPQDFFKVSDFLVHHYQPCNRDGNWLQPAWEYMHHHPLLDTGSLDKIRVWEDDGQIAAVAHYEWKLGEAFFQYHPNYTHLGAEMLNHAEAHLTGIDEDGRHYLHAYINDFDAALEAEANRRGYQKKVEYNRPTYRFAIPDPFPHITLPDGYRLKSLADENNLRKMHRVLWRGFDHAGEPPEEGLEWRIIMQSGPNFRLDLTIVVEAPDGNFAAFSGTWHETHNHIAYVEPVATDPDYRRMGLGKAAVLEGIRRCAAEGAREAYVGSGQEFYKALGFRFVFDTNCWVKVFEP